MTNLSSSHVEIVYVEIVTIRFFSLIHVVISTIIVNFFSNYNKY